MTGSAEDEVAGARAASGGQATERAGGVRAERPLAVGRETLRRAAARRKPSLLRVAAVRWTERGERTEERARRRTGRSRPLGSLRRATPDQQRRSPRHTTQGSNEREAAHARLRRQKRTWSRPPRPRRPPRREEVHMDRLGMDCGVKDNKTICSPCHGPRPWLRFSSRSWVGLLSYLAGRSPPSARQTDVVGRSSEKKSAKSALWNVVCRCF